MLGITFLTYEYIFFFLFCDALYNFILKLFFSRVPIQKLDQRIKKKQESLACLIFLLNVFVLRIKGHIRINNLNIFLHSCDIKVPILRESLLFTAILNQD